MPNLLKLWRMLLEASFGTRCACCLFLEVERQQGESKAAVSICLEPIIFQLHVAKRAQSAELWRAVRSGRHDCNVDSR
jgi:hypothetical protein